VSDCSIVVALIERHPAKIAKDKDGASRILHVLVQQQ
jgi:hypothetical protein